MGNTMSWSAGLGIGVAVGVVGVLAFAGTGSMLISRLGSPTASTLMAPFYLFFFSIASFVPFGMLMYGFISDMFNQEFRNSFVSLMALGGIAVSWLLGLAFSRNQQLDLSPMNSNASLAESGWCTLPGLEAFESPIFPMSFVSSSTIIFFYLLSGFIIRGGGWFPNQSLVIGSLITLTMQVMSFYAGGCRESYFPLFGSTVNNLLGAILFGCIIGGLSFLLVSGPLPQYQPFQGFKPGVVPGTTPSNGKGYGSTGPASEPNSATCSADPGDDNAYVATLYKNGQEVTANLAI
jgi:hypothetical protein